MSKTWANILGKGTRRSPQLDLSPVGELRDSLIEWKAFDGLSFDGDGDYVDIGDVIIDGLTKLTLEAWINPKSLPSIPDPNGHGGDDSYIIHKSGSSNDNLGLTVQKEGTAFYLDDGGGGDTLIASAPNVDELTHIAAVWNGSDMEIYIDGILDNSKSVSLGSLDDTSNSLQIGGRTDQDTWYDGIIDEMRIWNVARTQNEIQDNMNKELTGTETGLVAYYKMNEGSGTTLTDSAGTNDGTIYGAKWLNTIIETSTDDGETWQEATNGGNIPDLPDELENVELLIRQNLSTSDSTATPRLEELTVNIYKANPSIEDGQEIREAVFNYVSASQALDALAEKANFWWKIDKDKVLHFKSRESEEAPFVLSPADVRGKPEIKTGNPLYRNIQYVKGGVDITEEQTERFTASEGQRTFTVGFRIVEEPTVEVDYGTGWEEESIARKEAAEDEKWLWEKGENTVTRNRNASELDDGDRIRVTFIGEFNIIALSQDLGEVIRQSNIDGTSGIVEDSITESDIEGRESAIEKANAKLARYAKESKTLQFETRKNGLQAGQLIETENFDDLGIDTGEKLLITKVSTHDENGIIFHDVEAVKGPKHESWSSFFKELSRRAELVVREGIGESEILTIPISFEKEWTETERPNIFHEKYPSDDLYPSDDIYPMFRPQDRVKYLAWYDGEKELGRKEYTQQEGQETDEIFTLTYFGPNELVDTSITHFGWIGGFRATETEPESGIVVDKQEYEATKTDMESWQIEKTDMKGW